MSSTTRHHNEWLGSFLILLVLIMLSLQQLQNGLDDFQLELFTGQEKDLLPHNIDGLHRRLATIPREIEQEKSTPLESVIQIC